MCSGRYDIVTGIAFRRGSALLQSRAAVVQAAGPLMKHDYRDFALRVLFLTAGGVAALLLSLKGYGAALPAVAFGGALGAVFAASVGQPTRE